MNEDQPSPEHIQFMLELVENVKTMLGGDKMVAAIGEESNGCYAVLICMNPLPPALVIGTILAMLAEQQVKELGKRHNEMQFENMTTVKSTMVN